MKTNKKGEFRLYFAFVGNIQVGQLLAERGNTLLCLKQFGDKTFRQIEGESFQQAQLILRKCPKARGVRQINSPAPCGFTTKGRKNEAANTLACLDQEPVIIFWYDGQGNFLEREHSYHFERKNQAASLSEKHPVFSGR